MIVEFVQELRYNYNTEIDDDRSTLLQASQSLDGFTKLKSLVISCNGDSWDWIEMPPSLRSFVLRLTYLSTINTLKLEYMRKISPRDLIPCAGLKHLDIIPVSSLAREEDDILTTLNAEPIQLEQPPSNAIKIRLQMLRQKLPDGRSLLDPRRLKKNLHISLRAGGYIFGY